jgi:hypothetical protein
MNEAETRAEHVDPALKAAGWGAIEGSQVRREYPITLRRIGFLGNKSHRFEIEKSWFENWLCVGISQNRANPKWRFDVIN